MSQPAESRPPDAPPPGASAPAERLGIAGSGTVACGLAACAAAHGGPVIVWARSARSAERAQHGIEEIRSKLRPDDGTDRVRVTSTLSDLSAATLVVEAVAEDASLKREMLKAVGAELPPGAMFATTTSSLRISELAQACGRPGRFFGLHVFNPVHRMDLVELCFPAGTDSETRARAAAFCGAIGKRPVEVPDETGFVVNRLLFPYLFDAVRLLERTGMAPEEVDTCMKLGAAHPMGPLELLDLVGLDVAQAIGDAISAESGDPSHRPPERVRQLVREGKLGRKSGGGFHRYGTS